MKVKMGIKAKELEKALKTIGWKLKLIKKLSKPKEFYNTYRIVNWKGKDTKFILTDWNAKNMVTNVSCDSNEMFGDGYGSMFFTLEDCEIRNNDKGAVSIVSNNTSSLLSFYHWDYETRKDKHKEHIDTRQKYYKNNHKAILADQKQRRDNRRIKQERLDCNKQV
jgi:hypothetical protein